MTRRDSIDAIGGADEASRWFVRVDAGEPGADAELARWLAERPEHERGMERVELAVALARRLAAQPGSALHAEAAHAARLGRRWRRAFAWGGAMAAALLIAAFVPRHDMRPAILPETVAIEAARVVTFNPPSNPVAVLPSGAVIDAGAVAVLPFAAAGDATLAERLERDVVTALRTVPGLYVIADDAVRPYAATELEASDVGGLLGARGVLDAGVELVAGRVLIDARLRDSATGGTLWQARLDRPVDELWAVRDEIAQNIATAMFDSGLRAQAASPPVSDRGPAASKPFQQ